MSGVLCLIMQLDKPCSSWRIMQKKLVLFLSDTTGSLFLASARGGEKVTPSRKSERWDVAIVSMGR